MAILRELWSGKVNDEQELSTYQYVIKLRERLEQTCQLARDNLEKVQFKDTYSGIFNIIRLGTRHKKTY